MCGIFAVINKDREPVNLKKCKIALKTMHMRGPDWQIEQLIFDHIFLSQAVLSMTGEKKKNKSYHFSKSKNFFLLFVGELYNFKQLNNDYLKLKSDSDTNILVNLFEKFSKNKINNDLDGMYAYLLYDKINNSINISRDPNGEKTLYLFEDKKKIVISSEINPIINYVEKINLNFDVLKNYFLTRHYIEFEKNHFSNISKIPAGSNIEIDLNSFKKKKINQIYISDYIDSSKYFYNSKRSIDDLVEELDELLDKNIKEMIPRKRNIASIVSGGVDSALVTNYICKNTSPKYLIHLNHVNKDLHSGQIKKFESFFKKKINIHKINQDKYYENFLKCLEICNTPINSHSFVGNYINSSIAKSKNCRAIFGGEGADELFGGYSTYLNNYKKNLNNSDYTKISKNSFFLETQQQIFFKNKMKKLWEIFTQKYSFLKNLSDINKLSMMLMDATVQMESNAFRGGDLMSMNNSVESRNLFYRKDIVKFALNLPLKFKINISGVNYMKNKFILKKLFIKKFNKNLIFTKQGFAGFPNETIKYIGSTDNFFLKKFVSFSKIKNIYDLDRSLQWKILNTEFYLKHVGHKYI